MCISGNFIFSITREIRQDTAFCVAAQRIDFNFMDKYYSVLLAVRLQKLSCYAAVSMSL